MTLEQVWDSEPYLDARHRIHEAVQRKALVEMIGDALARADRDYFVLTRVPDFFERIAVLAEDGYIRQEEVERYFASAIVYYYDVFKDYFQIARQEAGDEDAWKSFEKAARKLQKKVQTQHPPASDPLPGPPC